MFLPSILVIACIASATLLYLKWIVKRFGDKFKSVEWREKNKWKFFWIVGLPNRGLGSPFVEELFFRAPLIIAFSAMSSFAWYGVLASSCLFSLSHWFGKKISMPEILSKRENSNHKSDDIETEIERLHQDKGKEIVVRRMLHMFFSLILGILAGYYGIKYQSIWVSVGIHSAWNLIMAEILPLFVLLFVSLGLLIYFAISSLWKRVRWRRRW